MALSNRQSRQTLIDGLDQHITDPPHRDAPEQPPPPVDPPPSASADDWILHALAAAKSTDDPNYWRRVIANDPNANGSSRDYWLMRIRKGDGAEAVRNGTEQTYGKGFTDANHALQVAAQGRPGPSAPPPTPPPAPVPTPTPAPAPGPDTAPGPTIVDYAPPDEPPAVAPMDIPLPGTGLPRNGGMDDPMAPANGLADPMGQQDDPFFADPRSPQQTSRQTLLRGLR